MPSGERGRERWCLPLVSAAAAAPPFVLPTDSLPFFIPARSDAIKSIRLFNLHQQVQNQPQVWQQMQEKLLASAPEPSFARKNPSFEGVCMGNRKSCTCGAPFFG